MLQLIKYIPSALVAISLILITIHELGLIQQEYQDYLDSIEGFLVYGIGLIVSTPIVLFSIYRLRKTRNYHHLIPLIIFGIGILVISTLIIYK